MIQPGTQTTPTLSTTVVDDGEGGEIVEYRIEGDLVEPDVYEAQRLQNEQIAQQQMMDVSRFMDEQHQVESAVRAIEEEKFEERRQKAHAELAALGISPETIDTMLRGI